MRLNSVYLKEHRVSKETRAYPSCPASGRTKLTSTLPHIHPFIHTFTHSFTHSFIHTFTHSFTHSFIHTFIHTFTHSFTHSFIHTFTHSFTHSFIHTFSHSFTHSEGPYLGPPLLVADQALVLEVDHQQVPAGQCDLQTAPIGSPHQQLVPDRHRAQERVLLILLEQAEETHTALA